ncbi:DUF2958 domain-containing protein [Methylobacterium sp. E-046]|uniref:DUF2958 domain-containing protein n=1 Tax=Methylobacterium sp. E-046 TaxID=2836576 RepID=UPI001FBA28D3|nr:DUF2958 domain-containing protein [Methylobacterium sp. E-046]MCJ2097464.1 DUF2958 domain-containing protein [Methylobacterium sp. E-046]
MILFTKPQLAKLLANGTATAAALAAGREPPDHKPVVKLFTPDAAATWLLTEIDPDEPDIAFGLCDLGMECAELGSVSLAELRALRGRLGLPVERDRHFEATHPLSVYARAGMEHGAIVTDPKRLDQAAAAEEVG